MKENWKLINKKKTREDDIQEIVNMLLDNRGLKTESERKEFIEPKHPKDIRVDDFGINGKSIKKVIVRVAKALKNGEELVVYGDYDADGICGTAILWETLNEIGLKVSPYIPERFSEGYGLNSKSVAKIKEEKPNLSLIISVDNGIVANNAVEKAKELGIDTIITDHHEKGEKYPKACAIIHTTKISGAGVAWVLARELRREFNVKNDRPFLGNGLELAAIGTIADQVPLVKLNRSICFYGLKILNKTLRPGLISLFQKSAVKRGDIGVYEVGFIIAPRLNATGRLTHAIESLRLLCMKRQGNALKQASLLGKVNRERQKVVEDVVRSVKRRVDEKNLPLVIVVSGEYHEGVIGLAASRLVETFYRPSIVICKEKEISKASCRSIAGFNIIDSIRQTGKLIESGGGHPMAAGFSIKTKNIKKFKKKINEIAEKKVQEGMLVKKVTADMQIEFSSLTEKLAKTLSLFEPTGTGNSRPTFYTEKVGILEKRVIGKDKRHIKMSLCKNKKTFDSIGFGMSNLNSKIERSSLLDIVFQFEENIWRGNVNLQIKLKDVDILSDGNKKG